MFRIKLIIENIRIKVEKKKTNKKREKNKKKKIIGND